MSLLPRHVEDLIIRVLPTMLGWCTVEKGIRLAELALVASPGTVSVELGVHGGRSLLPLALGHATAGYGMAFGIDAWDTAADLEGESDPSNREWWQTINQEAVYARCRADLSAVVPPSSYGFIRKRSLDPFVLDWAADVTITLLHQDSNHSPEVSCAEVKAWLPKLAPQAVWVMDDADWPSLQPARALLSEAGWVVAEDYTHWLVWRRG